MVKNENLEKLRDFGNILFFISQCVHVCVLSHFSCVWDSL